MGGIRFLGSAFFVAVALAAATAYAAEPDASDPAPSTAAPSESAASGPGSQGHGPADADAQASSGPANITAPSISAGSGLPSPDALGQIVAVPKPPPPPPPETAAPPPPAAPVAPGPEQAPAPLVAPPAPGGSAVLHLTFDDGPDPQWTPALLDILDRHGAKATFFELGREIDRTPQLAGVVQARGHALGNHTMTHPKLTEAAAGTATAQIQAADAKLGPTTCFRPPYGAINDAIRGEVAALGRRVVLWDVDTRDWQKPGTEVIVQRILSGARPGATILMHDSGGDRSQTLAATDQALGLLAAAGWRFEAIPGC